MGSELRLLSLPDDRLGQQAASISTHFGSWLLQEMRRLVGRVVTVNPATTAALDLTQRIYFLDGATSLGRFLGHALGVLRYPACEVQRGGRVFRTRQCLDAYVASLQFGAAVDDLLEVGPNLVERGRCWRWGVAVKVTVQER